MVFSHLYCPPLRLVIIIRTLYRAECGGAAHTRDQHHHQAGEVAEGRPHRDRHVQDSIHHSEEILLSLYFLSNYLCMFVLLLTKNPTRKLS